jgi:hypothetical protein
MSLINTINRIIGCPLNGLAIKSLEISVVAYYLSMANMFVLAGAAGMNMKATGNWEKTVKT